MPDKLPDEWLDDGAAPGQQAADKYEYRILSGGSKAELEKNMNTSANAGFRFIAFQASLFGSTLIGHAVMERPPQLVATVLPASKK